LFRVTRRLIRVTPAQKKKMRDIMSQRTFLDSWPN